MGDRRTLLQLGTAKVDITPRFALPLAGFAFRSGVFDRVQTPIFARVFCFKTEGSPPVILVSADLIWWGHELVSDIRRMVRTHSGLEQATIILHATHSHSGPQTSESLSPLIGKASPEYLDFLKQSVLEAIDEAVAAVEPVTIERGSGQCDIGIYRRRLVDGVIQMAPNLDGPNDQECTVIRFRKRSGSAKAVLVHFTCHPTTTAENSVSAEFCGAAMTTIEQELGHGVTAAYLQGCCGDIRPALIRDEQFYRGDAEDVSRLGAVLSTVVASVLNGAMEPCKPTICTASETIVPISFENESGLVQMEMTRVRLAQNLGFLTFNAETVLEYGLWVKAQSGGTILPLGYTNGMIGYVTTEQQLIEGGYESRRAFSYFGMPGPFHPSTERQVKESIDTLLRD
jgi:hypothetical protein